MRIVFIFTSDEDNETRTEDIETEELQYRRETELPNMKETDVSIFPRINFLNKIWFEATK